jgi:hypothetical protein
MPKSLKKKTTAKPVAAKKLKKAPVSRVAKVEEPEGSFMWRLLKKKEAERMRLSDEKHKSLIGGHKDGQLPKPNHQQGFSRFAGPRRKAA